MVNEQPPLPPSEPPVRVRLVAPDVALGSTPQAPLKPLGDAILRPGPKFATKPTPVSGSDPEFARLKLNVVVGIIVADANGICVAPNDTPFTGLKIGGPRAASPFPAPSINRPAIPTIKRNLLSMFIRSPLFSR